MELGKVSTKHGRSPERGVAARAPRALRGPGARGRACASARPGRARRSSGRCRDVAVVVLTAELENLQQRALVRVVLGRVVPVPPSTSPRAMRTQVGRAARAAGHRHIARERFERVQVQALRAPPSITAVAPSCAPPSTQPCVPGRGVQPAAAGDRAERPQLVLHGGALQGGQGANGALLLAITKRSTQTPTPTQTPEARKAKSARAQTGWWPLALLPGRAMASRESALDACRVVTFRRQNNGHSWCPFRRRSVRHARHKLQLLRVGQIVQHALPVVLGEAQAVRLMVARAKGRRTWKRSIGRLNAHTTSTSWRNMARLPCLCGRHARIMPCARVLQSPSHAAQPWTCTDDDFHALACPCRRWEPHRRTGWCQRRTSRARSPCRPQARPPHCCRRRAL